MSNAEVSSFDEDAFTLKPFCDRLENFLLVEKDFVDGSLVVSLHAKFGMGKSTFLRMWAHDLLHRQVENGNLPQPILLNAWDSDFCGDPLLAIVTGLIDAVAKSGSTEKNENVGKLREAAKDIAWFVAGLANSFVANTSGIDPIAAGGFAETKKAGREKEAPDYLSIYQHRTTALHHLKATLREVFGPSKSHALVMVDELDRCRPDYAISYLETIKHVFDVPGLTFVLAIDYEHLSNSARSLFGKDLAVEEYFRKFVHRSFSLPEPDKQGVQQLANRYTQAFLERDGKRASLLDFAGGTRVRNISELVTALGLTPRQVQEVFRIVGHALARKPGATGSLFWCIGPGVILLAALKVGNAPLYVAAGRADVQSAKQIAEFLVLKLGADKAQWWLCIYLTGITGRPGGQVVDVDAELRAMGLLAEGDSMRNQWGQFGQGWGHFGEGRIAQIFKTIESAGGF